MPREIPAASDGPGLLPRVDSYLEWYACHRPEDCAAVHGDLRVNYSELHARVRDMSRALLASGVRKEDRVAMLAPPGLDYWVNFLAVTSIGAIWVGLNPRYSLAELAHVISDSEPCQLFSRGHIGGRDYSEEILSLCAIAPKVEKAILLEETPGFQAGEMVHISDFLMRGQSVTDEQLEDARKPIGGRDACMIVYTSGSTGKPKGALLHHEGMTGYGLVQNRTWPVEPLRMLNYFPINHVGCVVDASIPTLVAGGTLVFMEQFDTRGSLQIMQDEKITIMGSVPSVHQMQLAHPEFDQFDLSSIQLIAWAGAKMPASTLERLFELNVPLATNYGMTESCSAITITPPTRDFKVLSETVGWPSEGSEIRLVSAEGDDVADGQEGEILVRSPYNMLGYWRRPEATAQTLSSDGWMRTGDTARKNPDGSYSIVGRLKEMYKSGGYNVYPKEIEEVLERHEGVEAAAVIAVEDPVWQEVGIAYVQAAVTVSPEELVEHCRASLANYKIPKCFIILDEFPLLPIGKIDKVSLRARAADDYINGDKSV